MTTEETAWLAGLIEGEGSFEARADRRWPNAKINVSVRIKMSDEDVVRKAADIMGIDQARVTCKPDTRSGRFSDMFEVRAFSADAVRVMRAVHPHMGARRGARIDECLAARPDLTREENA